MDSTWITDIPRPCFELANAEMIGPSITNVEHLSSYNWIESSSPTIAVPGCPPLWSPPKAAKKVTKDSGLIYIAQNAFRLPESPLEPLFRSLYTERPSYDIHEVDVITDRNNVRKLLSYINPNLSRNGPEPFTIEIEVKDNTAIFCRAETETHTFIGPLDFRGYGHQFEKAFTTAQVSGSTGHHRIISYNLGDLKLMLRYETDAYVEVASKLQPRSSGNEDILNMMENLSLSRSENYSRRATESKLAIQEKGKRIPIDLTLEIKTRVFHKPIDIQEVLPQLWVSQTPNLVRAYHKSGTFEPPEVEDVTCDIHRWEQDHAHDIWSLVVLIKEIIRVVRENDGNAIIKYDGRSDSLAVSKREGSRMLPVDLYSKFGDKKGSTQANESISRRTTLKIGDTFHNVDLLTIPYLSSFVRFQRLAQPQNTDFIHRDIPLFDIALKGLESGYRQCFRCLRGNIPRYHTLCETYHFLGIDVPAGKTIENIFVDLRACKTVYELGYKSYRGVRGDKSRARDAAFRLLFLIIRGEFGDERNEHAKVYNAVLFIVSHPGTFKKSTRIAVRSVFEERFVISMKQRSQLDRWRKRDTTNSSGDEDNRG
ncbi:hypothetical protein N7532_001995 [Penicillium argentinense]|uniref:Geranylgeranyl pyrophosphate synthetase n=1 Tax=Penicillium argentinense TaxID=1131581 RepID=A0A9W9G3H8_9EURO|nr:uncharacterized protein N7532_001995 [Penicillium argentinense]KAJ5111460.1 hypothetical protein N7532_001995 [Penicillium argentinense]